DRDTREKDIQTAMEAAALSPDGARIYPAVVVADTALYEWYKSGEYRPLSVDEACSIAAEMLEIFEDAGIPVIRIGLNASETLSNEVVAGAYHPSLGEMTRSRLYLKRAASLLESRTASGEIRIGVNPSCISLMVGQKRENIRKLEECYPGTQIKVRAVDVLPGKVVLLD
ncbi:MAG: radical SAM protein, partial [Clostridiales bacterium]|nr:radical SAM protein [Clostridiales bacterium]